eukprot:1492710-Prymnesium_polylepis.1
MDMDMDMDVGGPRICRPLSTARPTPQPRPAHGDAVPASSCAGAPAGRTAAADDGRALHGQVQRQVQPPDHQVCLRPKVPEGRRAPRADAHL